MSISIAIDGPAGAGKSTIAKMLAKKLNYIYLDSGAMYRAVTLKALENNVDLNDSDSLRKLVKSINIEIKNRNSEFEIYLDGKNITDDIRCNKVDNNVSKVAQIKEVRDELVKKQRDIAKKDNIVMDGRDIGTRVLSKADFKFYITASVDERAKRRYKDVLARGEKNVDINKIKEKIIKRDKVDSNRKYSPLRKAKDARKIDTTNLSKKEVLEKILLIIKGE